VRWACRCLLWGCLLLWLGVCRAEVVILEPNTQALSLAGEVEVLEDESGNLSLADVRGGRGVFHPAILAHGQLNFGYRNAAIWLKLRLRNETARPDWLLEVAFPSLDRVECYESGRGPGSSLEAQWVSGDRLPFAERPIPHRNFVFPVTVGAGEEREIYLRVVSQGSLTLPLYLWQAESFRQHNQDIYALLSLYYGMLLALGLYNLLLFVALKDRAYLLYVAFVASMAVGQLTLNGLGNQYLWPQWPAWGNVALVVGFNATGLFGALFTRQFLETWRLPNWDRIILALAAGFALACVGPLVVPYRPVAVVTSLLGIGFSCVAVVTALVAVRRGHPGAWLFLMAWLLLLAGVGVMGMRNLAWLPTNILTTYAMQLGSASEMLLLSFALADRINAMRREKEIAQGLALQARMQEVTTLQQVERVLEERVLARTRELADANERLLSQEDMLRHLAHHDYLTGLPNRLLLEDRLEQAILKGMRQQTGVAVLWVDLDAFKPVNDQHGHAVGDEVLCILAERFRGLVRAADTVARLGGDEFVFIIDDLHCREDAFAVADKVVSEAALPVHRGRQCFTVGASVGVAYWPDDSRDPQALLQRADEAMYAAKAAGRSRWVSAAE